MIQKEVSDFISSKPFSSAIDDIDQITKYEELIDEIKTPLTKEEAKILLTALPDTDNDWHGLVWTLIHKIETNTEDIFSEKPAESDSPWLRLLWIREEAAKHQ